MDTKRKNVLVKISGNLLENPQVMDWLRQLSQLYYLVICIGGGEQISAAFAERGWPIKFGPMGRICETFEQRQLARDILEKNQATVQDALDIAGINARVLVPVTDIGGVICHINGDLQVLAAYNGYDKLFILTLKDRVEKKRQWLSKVAGIFSEAIESGELDKIEVVGF